nr:transposase [Pyrinomonadaceae bacterium]
TKDRFPFIADAWKPRLHAYVGGIIKNLNAVPLGVGGMADHLHILTGLTTGHRVDYFVRDVKSDSSIFVRRGFESKFSWQKGYGIFTVSPSAVEDVREYILNQEAHHAKRTFQEEYVELLIRSGTAYDEKYLW